ncbi:MAG: GrdX family protein [Oscillospiraceae bacterium]|nr:GrdX family protein [Oscillospiraceae bacterium]
MQIVTNNPLVREKLQDHYAVDYAEGSFGELLVRVRDKAHLGYRLLSHPLSGSVKPNETPYKSVLISDGPGALDVESLTIIENSILTADKFPVKYPQMSAKMRADFQLIDYTLLQSAL